MNFLWPEALLLLIAPCLLALAYMARSRRKSAAMPGLELPRMRRGEQHLPVAIYLLALVVAALAAARPTALVTLPSGERELQLDFCAFG